MQIHLFLACLIMFLLTMSVLLTLFIRRMADIRGGVTSIKYFKTYDVEAHVPIQTRQLERNYENLFETPLLFYAVMGLILALGFDHLHLVVLAYAYVGLRVCHSLVHITSNKLIPRMTTFFLSLFVLLLLWVRTLLLV